MPAGGFEVPRSVNQDPRRFIATAHPQPFEPVRIVRTGPTWKAFREPSNHSMACGGSEAIDRYAMVR
jgi:hypothetical protein